VGDFNDDGKDDILWRNSQDGRNVLYFAGTANLAGKTLSTTSQNLTPRADLNELVAGVGDFNGDGKADILWRNESSGANEIWLGGNSTTVQTVNTVNTQWKIAGV